MLEIIEITIKEFEETIYDKYVTLFPENEQRPWNIITKTYKNGIEKFYKIVNGNKTIGFFMLEKLNDKYPYYIDYFAIFKEHQNKGYGTEAIQKILEKVGEAGVCFEIEKETENEPHTIKRAEFYKRLGFREIESEYLLYGVPYTPYIYIKNGDIGKTQIDQIMFDYYITNVSRKAVEKHCKIIK